MADSMDWNDLAGSQLPHLGGITTIGGNGLSYFPSSFPSSSSAAEDGTLEKIETLEDAVNRKEHEIMNEILQQAMEDARKSTDEAIEAQIQAAWEADLQKWIRQLGGGSAAAPSIRDSPRVRPTLPSTSNRSSNALVLGAAPSNVLHDPELVEEHLKIVRNMRTISASGIVDQFSRLTEERNYHGYESAWKLFTKLVQVPTLPLDQARATLAYFAEQYRDVIARKLNLSNASLLKQCEAYAQTTLGVLSEHFWAIVYFLLRCGDAVSAHDVVVMHGADSIDPAVQRLVASLAQAQGSVDNLWQGSTYRITLDSGDRQGVADQVESLKRTERPNMYQVGVYSLLSGQQPLTSSDTVEGFKMIEDYLYSALWRAVMVANPVDELIELSNKILTLGPSHFQDASGWSFALPLLATQQYRKALLWLSDAGGQMGLLQATHMGLALSHAGIVVKDLGRTDSADDTVASLVVAYSSLLLSSRGSLVAMDYLVRIPNEVRARKEIARLIADSGELDQLAGTITRDGTRQGGALSELFASTEVSAILAIASQLSSANKDDLQKTANAVTCLMLAERYGDLIVLLSTLLSPPDKPDKNREFWVTQVVCFHHHYTDQQTHVTEVLNAEGKKSLIETSRMLLDLNTLFDRIRQGRPSAECWNIIDKLNFLPNTKSELNTKDILYRGMDPLIKNSYPALLVVTMELLYKDHSSLKRELHGVPTGTVRERIKALQSKARLYNEFAASVGMSSDQFARLTKLVSLMI